MSFNETIHHANFTTRFDTDTTIVRWHLLHFESLRRLLQFEYRTARKRRYGRRNVFIKCRECGIRDRILYFLYSCLQCLRVNWFYKSKRWSSIVFCSFIVRKKVLSAHTTFDLPFTACCLLLGTLLTSVIIWQFSVWYQISSELIFLTNTRILFLPTDAGRCWEYTKNGINT